MISRDQLQNMIAEHLDRITAAATVLADNQVPDGDLETFREQLAGLGRRFVGALDGVDSARARAAQSATKAVRWPYDLSRALKEKRERGQGDGGRTALGEPERTSLDLGDPQRKSGRVAWPMDMSADLKRRKKAAER